MSSPDKCDDSNAKIYLELAKIQQESIFNRRSYEWKLAFGLWTSIGVVTYFLVEHGDLCGGVSSCGVAMIYFALMLVWCVFWQAPLHRAAEQDKWFKHYYMDRAEGMDRERPETVKFGDLFKRKHIVLWTIGQSAMTAVFLIASWYVIHLAGSFPSSEQKEHDVDSRTKARIGLELSVENE